MLDKSPSTDEPVEPVGVRRTEIQTPSNCILDKDEMHQSMLGLAPHDRKRAYYKSDRQIHKAAPAVTALQRPTAKGKFLFVGEEKFWVRGVTYGTFRSDDAGICYPSPIIVERDFAAMQRAGINSVRLYTVPPIWLLDLAASHGLRAMIGLPWEQHVSFLDNKREMQSIANRVRDGVRSCAGHQAVLGYAVGNEIPASTVRWYGRRRIQSCLENLCRITKEEDRNALVTYVNYPSTEYLELPFVDCLAFNVYLESQERLAAYLRRLQNLAGEKPLLLAELGLDSLRHGEGAQAHSLEWQVRTSFESGCAGAFVFAWTDEWHRGGREIEDWKFGLTTRERHPKQALAAVAKAFGEVPFRPKRAWPRVSVVVCSYNGEQTIGETLSALNRLNYPDYEVIVIDDGSTDKTSAVAQENGAKLIRTENKGLSHARNLGLQAATGSIVAYIDDDAYPDPDWLNFLAFGFLNSEHVGIGGPNYAPTGDRLLADGVAHAPGGPVHVLLSDEVAEHIPGCNMAYRIDQLREIGGFDPRFRVAGDDVDICWRLQERGWTLGFSPAALVWHHRRSSIGAYWKQQKGYAYAEALLSEKWPQKYNGAGHLSWSGRLYGKGVTNFFLNKPRIYHGIWGSAPFQSIYEPADGLLAALPLMPEWYFVVGLLGVFCVFGFAWSPLLILVPVLVVALSASLIQAALTATRQRLDSEPTPRRLKLRLIIFLLHLLQPLARLIGRIRHGIGPWDREELFGGPLSMRETRSIWSESWKSSEMRLASIEQILHHQQTTVRHGEAFDRWDLEICGGLLGSTRVLAMHEEHGAGKQLFRVRTWPHVPGAAVILFAGLTCVALIGAYQQAWLGVAPLLASAVAIAGLARAHCARAMRRWRNAITTYTANEGLTRL